MRKLPRHRLHRGLAHEDAASAAPPHQRLERRRPCPRSASAISAVSRACTRRIPPRQRRRQAPRSAGTCRTTARRTAPARRRRARKAPLPPDAGGSHAPPTSSAAPSVRSVDHARPDRQDQVRVDPPRPDRGGTDRDPEGRHATFANAGRPPSRSNSRAASAMKAMSASPSVGAVCHHLRDEPVMREHEASPSMQPQIGPPRRRDRCSSKERERPRRDPRLRRQGRADRCPCLRTRAPAPRAELPQEPRQRHRRARPLIHFVPVSSAASTRCPRNQGSRQIYPMNWGSNRSFPCPDPISVRVSSG